jgi:hypothetical protein
VTIAAMIMLMILVSLVATWLAPETVDRDLTTPHDAHQGPSTKD